MKDDEVDKYLCEHLTKALVKFLTSQLYVEGHYDGLYVLTVLYTNMRSRGTYIYEVLKTCLPFVTGEAIQRLETNLSESKNTREQRNAMSEFITSCKNGENFEDENYSKNRKNQLELVTKKKKNESNIMNDPFIENGALGNLFDGD
jgi:exportin-5